MLSAMGIKRRSSGKPSAIQVQADRAPPIAILGYSLCLPSNLDIQGSELARIARDGETTFVDYLESGILLPHEYGEGDPWRYQHRVGNKFRPGDLEMGIGFDHALLQVSEKEGKFMDTAVGLVMNRVWDTLETVGIPPSLLQKTRTGIFTCAMKNFGGYTSYPDETALRSGLNSGFSDRIAYFLGTHGPTLAFETACSSSLVALTLAVNAIRDGSCDTAIITAINVASVEYELSLQATGVISKEGQCRPFADDASGTLRCEGEACMFVCSMEWAIQNGYSGTIKCLVVNSAIGSAGADPKAAQGSGRIYESPNVFGMAEMIRLCHEQVGLPLGNISYIEAHATGTKVGDLVELEALGAVYGDSHDIQRNPLRVGSIKGNIGHAELAAGLFSLIKAVEMIRARTFFPTGGRDITPRADFDWAANSVQLCQEVEPFPPREQCYIGVNSFGIGGSYAHTIITEYVGDSDDDPVESTVCPLLLTLSAASERHLVLYEKQILEYLQASPGEVGLLDLCGLFALNRARLPCTRSYIVESIDGLINDLVSESKTRVSDGSASKLAVAMVFTGQGSQWVGMGSGLMVFRAFRDVATRFDALYKRLSGWSPLDKLTSLSDDQMDHTMYAQPLTFMVQVGLVELLAYLGVRADVVVGHSAGEIAALYCCGLLSLEDAAAVVWHRSRCQQAVAGNGRMLAIQLGSADAKAILRDPSLDVSSCEIACVNSPTSVVMAGPQAELERVRGYLSIKGVKSTFLKGSTAFHCSLMDPILSEVDARLEFLNRRTAKGSSDVTFLSTVSSRALTSVTSEYFVHNIRQPVRFCETIDLLLRLYEPGVVLELGPHKTLAPLLSECIQAASQKARVLSSLSKGAEDVACFWNLVRGLTEAGVSVDLGPVYTDMGYRFRRVEEKGIPRHPKIQRVSGDKWIEMNFNYVRGMRDIGPAAGTLASEHSKLVSMVEISKATSSSMAEHVMGGMAILPGAYYVEAAIEAWGMGHDACMSMTDVTFQDMCPIPDRSQNEPRNLFVRHSADKSSRFTSFTVDSRPIHSSDTTVHCTGEMASFARPDSFDGSQYMPGVKGTWQKSPVTRDIGEDGIRKLCAAHQLDLSEGSFYTLVNQEGIAHYGPSFQVVDEVRRNFDGSSVVASLHFGHDQWSGRGGVYGVQLLDGIFQLCYLNPYMTSGFVVYAGGFDLGLFLRAPVENPCFVHMQFVEDHESYGQTVRQGDALMYDSKGRLLCHLIGINSIVGKRAPGVLDAVPVWQPLSMAPIAEDRDAGACDPDRSSAVARIIADVLRRKHDLVRGEACYLRVLECWDDCHSVPSVFAALAGVDDGVMPEFAFLVEVFVGTHDDGVMKRSYVIPQKHKQWLKLRLVSLPSGHMTLDCYNFCFDVVSVGARGPWKDPMEFLSFASRLGYRGSVILHDFDIDQVSKLWEGYVGGCQEHPGGFSSGSLLDRALLGALEVDGFDQSIFIVSKDVNLSRQLCAAFEKVASECSARVSIHFRDAEAIHQLAAEVSCVQGGERHVVILDGVVDESEYTSDTFVLSATIARAIGVESSATCFLWLVASNAFVPPINVHRASLHPLVGEMAREYNHTLRPKYVDLASPRESPEALASLILSRPGPTKFMIDVDGVVHQRLLLPREVARPPRRVAVRADDPDKFYKLDLVKPNRSTGRQGGYEFFAHQVDRPEAGEVLVDIQYASLNFRDVMLTLNALPRSSMEASFYTWHLGMEAAGTIAEVGPGVHHVAPGDMVMVSARGTIASKVTVAAGNVLPLDSSLPMKEAACVSSVYTTAYHALIDLCRLRKGDRVLVHAAAGGVGHAAISVCRYIGAEVFATVSHAKQDYCIKALGVPESRVFNSRDVSWFHDLMRCTDGEGVDVVLNSLAGEHQKLGLQSLRPGGAFCEIGKYDIFNNERLLLFAFRKNIRFFAIDMDRMALEDPVGLREISQKVAEGFASGHFEPVPYTCFSMDNIRDAMQLMKSGAHIGKVLLSNSVEDDKGEVGPLTIQSRALVRCGADTYHMVLGGAGGIGAKLVRWLFGKGARRFLVTVRQDPSRVTNMFADLLASGAIFEVVEVDLSSAEGYEAIEKAVMGPTVRGRVESIVHAAGFWEPFSFQDIGEEPLKRQCDVKVQAAMFLDQLSRRLGSVARFILVGSSSYEQTNRSLATYAASNAMLAAVGRKRLSEGLPSTLLGMTTLIDVGLIARDAGTLEFQKKSGVQMINSACALLKIESMLSEDTPEMVNAMYLSPHHLGTGGAGWTVFFSTATPLGDPVLLFGDSSLRAGASAYMTYEGILDRVVWLFIDSMGVDAGDVSASSSLAGLGVDSLAIMDVGQHLLDEFGYQIDRTAFAMTIGDLAREIHQTKKAKEVSASSRDHEAITATAARSPPPSLQPMNLTSDGHEVPHQLLEPRDQPHQAVKIMRYYSVTRPKAYAVICPGLMGGGWAYADWKLDDVQVLVVESEGYEGNPNLLGKVIAEELYTGFLKGSSSETGPPKCVLLGHSFGAVVSLQVCRELLEVHSFSPTGLIPICHVAPWACGSSILDAANGLLPKAVQRRLVKRALKHEYQFNEAAGVEELIPSIDELFQEFHRRAARAKVMMRELKRHMGERRRYIGTTPLNYVYASKDRIGNPRRIRDPMRHGWAEVTSATVGLTRLYGNHACILDPIQGPAARDCILDIAHGMVCSSS